MRICRIVNIKHCNTNDKCNKIWKTQNLEHFCKSFLRIEKNGDTLLVKQDNKTIECKADFGQLFKLIDDDRLLRQQDSAEFYWEHFGKVIEQELNKLGML